MTWRVYKEDAGSFRPAAVEVTARSSAGVRIYRKRRHRQKKTSEKDCQRKTASEEKTFKKDCWRKTASERKTAKALKKDSKEGRHKDRRKKTGIPKKTARKTRPTSLKVTSHPFPKPLRTSVERASSWWDGGGFLLLLKKIIFLTTDERQEERSLQGVARRRGLSKKRQKDWSLLTLD